MIERGIGETRMALVDDGHIIEARIIVQGTVTAGTVLQARLTDTGVNGRNAVATDSDGCEYLLPRGAAGVAQGASFSIEVTREAIPGSEPWKRSLARVTDKPEGTPFQPEGRAIAFPSPRDELAALGWDQLIDEARSGMIGFAGGELRVSPTPAMTLIDVDGYLPAEELAVVGAGEAAKAIRRLDIGGSIGIDLPTARSKAARQDAAAAIDRQLAQPFERTAVNGFGFAQIVRPRSRPSLVELAQDSAAFEARGLLRRAAFEPAGAKRLVAHPAVTAVLGTNTNWLEALGRQVGGSIELRADPALPISGGYAEPA